jgi:hypothetical protein
MKGHGLATDIGLQNPVFDPEKGFDYHDNHPMA